MNTTEISSGLNWTSIFKAFHRTQMRLRRDRLRIILRPCAICHKFRLFTGFAAGRPPGRPLRYRIQAINEDSVY